MGRTAIAESYLVLLRGRSDPHEGLYVRLAYKYGVPFGRIVNLSGVPAERALAHIEGEC